MLDFFIQDEEDINKKDGYSTYLGDLKKSLDVAQIKLAEAHVEELAEMEKNNWYNWYYAAIGLACVLLMVFVYFKCFKNKVKKDHKKTDGDDAYMPMAEDVDQDKKDID